MLGTHCHWRFFSLLHILWNWASANSGHLREPVTLTPIAERLALELVLPVFTTQVCQAWDWNTVQSHHRVIVIAPSCHGSIDQNSIMVRWCDSELHGPIRIPYLPHTSFNYRGSSDNNVTWMKCKLYDSSHLGGYYERRYFVVSLPFYYSFLNFELDVKFLSRNNRILGYIKLFQQKKLSRNYEKRSRNYEKIKS